MECLTDSHSKIARSWAVILGVEGVLPIGATCFRLPAQIILKLKVLQRVCS